VALGFELERLRLEPGNGSFKLGEVHIVSGGTTEAVFP
jgi:hypothetical protein